MTEQDLGRFSASHRRENTGIASRIGRQLRRISLVINTKAIVVSALAIGFMVVSVRFGLLADFPLALIATAIIFPIVFSIGGAYKRREAALDDYGGIKAHGRAIYFAARDWLEETGPATLSQAQTVLGDLLKNCRNLFSVPISEMHDAEKFVARLEL